MKMKMKVLLVGLTMSQLASAQTPVLEVLDPVCVADQARQCFETIAPAQVKGAPIPGAGIFGGWSCPPSYTQPLGLTGTAPTCTRGMKSVADAAALLPVLQACELDARIHYPASCVRKVPVDELVTTMRVDMRKLLSDFCKTYTSDADKSKCDLKNEVPSASAAQ